MKERLSAQQLRELLRSADPLRDDAGPDAASTARLRRVVLAEASSAEPAASWRSAPALVAAVLLLLAVHVGWTLFDSADRRTDSAEIVAAPGVTSPALIPETADTEIGRRQQVQFVTANGTRVIWVLSSDLSL